MKISDKVEEFVRQNEKMNSSLITDWNREMLLQAIQIYADQELKLLGIGVVIERFSIGQPVKWEGMKFWVAEDNGDSKVLVCNCEDTKDIQQSEYNDWWVDRDVLNGL